MSNDRINNIRRAAQAQNAQAGRHNVEPSIDDSGFIEDTEAGQEEEVYEEAAEEAPAPAPAPRAAVMRPAGAPVAAARPAARPAAAPAAVARPAARPATATPAARTVTRSAAAPAPQTALARQAPAAIARPAAPSFSMDDILNATRTAAEATDATALRKQALAGMDAYHSWLPNATTTVRVIPWIEGPPFTPSFGHWSDEANRTVPCLNMHAGLPCVHCDNGVALKRALLAIGYVINKDGSTDLQPKIFRFNGSAVRQVAEEYEQNPNLFDLEVGYALKISIDGKGQKAKMSAALDTRYQGPAFSSPEEMVAFYEEMRGVVRTLQNNLAVTEVTVGEEDDESPYAPGADA
jgi:hypothetical protein